MSQLALVTLIFRTGLLEALGGAFVCFQLGISSSQLSVSALSYIVRQCKRKTFHLP